MSKTIKVLCVAGGGAGGHSFNNSGTDFHSGGGGGAGGYQYEDSHPITSGSYPVSVGVGGSVTSVKGQDTTFDTITAIGGGRGGQINGDGRDGGNGGGAIGNGISNIGEGSQGYDGGEGYYYAGGSSNSGGGGGASENGKNATNTKAGNGGDGILNSISGTPVYYAGGGGGGSWGEDAGNGGLGGGGDGSTYGDATDGVDGLGAGGGGVGFDDTFLAGTGGRGIVIIRYVTADFGACTGGTITTDGADTIHTFTDSGTFTVYINKSGFFHLLK